jgi:hypothetical protein
MIPCLVWYGSKTHERIMSFKSTERMVYMATKHFRDNKVPFKKVDFLGFIKTFVVHDTRIEFYTRDEESDYLPSGSIGSLERVFDHKEDATPYKKTIVVVNDDSWLLNPTTVFETGFVSVFSKSKVWFMTLADACDKVCDKATTVCDKVSSSAMVQCECGKLLKTISKKHLTTKYHIANAGAQKTPVVEEKDVDEKGSDGNCPCGVLSKRYTLKHLNSKRHQQWVIANPDYVDSTLLKCECGMFIKKRSAKHEASSKHQAWVCKQSQVVVEEGPQAVVEEEPQAVVEEEPQAVVEEEPQAVVEDERRVVVEEERQAVDDKEEDEFDELGDYLDRNP